MTTDDLIPLLEQAGICQGVWFEHHQSIERLAALVAAEKEQQMLRDGWRQCAEGQRTTQHCGLLDAAVRAEREACAKVCEDYTDRYAGCEDEGHGYEIAAAIRARGEA